MRIAFFQFIILASILFPSVKVSAQESEDSVKTPPKRIREYERNFQFSLFPGISSNSIYSGSYFNNFSFNLFGGLSAGNHIFEFSPVINLNLKKSTGIQMAGLANVIGANAFVNLTPTEERALVKDGFESNMHGIQVGGVLNYVRTHTTGIQTAGMINIVGQDFHGVQVAGLGNTSGGFASGLQLAGAFNTAFKSMSGVQISAIYNGTDGQLSGTQVGLINKAKFIKGKKSTPPTRSRGMQIGFVNFSKSMDGIQVGVVNFGGKTRGVQVALVNFFDKVPSKEKVKMGTPIALLNFGSKGSVFRVYYNELFTANVEYTTGNCLNCSHVLGSEMPFDDRNQKFNQNALILGYNRHQDTWGFGYGFDKILYNKATIMPNPENRKRTISYGLNFLHLNRSMKLDKDFNLVNKLHVDYGKRIRSFHWMAGLSLNYFLYELKEQSDSYKINSFRISTGKMLGLNSEFWPGYRLGFQF